LLILLIVSLSVFAQTRYPLLFLLLPPLLLVVVRMGFSGAAFGISLIATVAIVATLGGSGPFMLIDSAPTAERVFTMQLLLGSLILTTYPIGAMLATQQRLGEQSEQQLQALAASQARVIAMNERMKLAAGAARVGFYSLDFVTREIEWDAEMFRMFQIDPDCGPLTYEAWRARVHPLDLARVEQRLQDMLRSPGVELDMDFRTLLPTGEECDLRSRGIIQRDARGRALKLIGLNIDITELRRLDRMKSEFVSIVSHELRTPLTSIRGALGLLNNPAAPPEKQRTLVDLAHRNAERLAVLVDDILDMEKIESGKMRFDLQPHDLAGLIQQALASNAIYAARHGARLQLQGEIPPIPVCVDANRFLQVMANLLSNAAKFSPRGASVDLTAAAHDRSVRIAVRDHGPGIAAAFQAKIFGKFCQGDASDSRIKGGSGLGLAISKALIERMDGSISFITSAQAGTTFFIDLPVAAKNEFSSTGRTTVVDLRVT
jgi:signal transduction histidine kinase